MIDADSTKEKKNGAAEPVYLRAGRIGLWFDHGAIRNIAVDDVELAQQIYGAVRDRNWETVPATVEKVAIEKGEDWFAASFDVLNRSEGIVYAWQGRIVGEATSRVTFSFRGVAGSEFLKNRIGLCLLSPLSCAGAECEVEHADGSLEKGRFPRSVAPRQPFLSLRRLSYRLPDGAGAALTFLGDEFETEDQRNWTDASFKTYSTPLALPFPVMVRPGDRVEQDIIVSYTPATGNKTTSGDSGAPPERNCLAVIGASSPLPRLGLSWTDDDAPETAKQVVRALSPEILSLDVDLENGKVPGSLLESIATVTSLEADILVRVKLSGNADPKALDALASLFPRGKADRAMLLLPPLGELSCAARLRSLLDAIPEGICRGVGVATHLAELNRNRPVAPADFLAFSASPQVHAFDDASVMENLPGLAAALRDGAGFFADGKGVALVPLTLRNHHVRDPLVPLEDPRQKTLFGAAWLAGAMLALAEGGAAVAVLFNRVLGGLGFAEVGENGKVTYYPLFHVARLMFASRGGMLTALGNANSRVGGFRLTRNDETILLIYNLGNEPASAVIAEQVFPEQAKAWVLGPATMAEAAVDPDWIFAIANGRTCGREIQLAPYGVACIRGGGEW